MSTFILSLLCFAFPVVHAAGPGMDFGDVLALIIGLTIGVVGILSCLGQYARNISSMEPLRS